MGDIKLILILIQLIIINGTRCHSHSPQRSRSVRTHGRFINTNSRKLFYSIYHGPEITFALQIHITIVDKRELV